MVSSKLLRTLFRTALVVPAGLSLGLLPLTSGPANTGVLLAPYLPRSPHQAYGYTLAQTRLSRNPIALEWLAAGEQALRVPEPVAAPFEILRPFPAEAPAAAAFSFAVRDGQRAELDAAITGAAVGELFVELYRAAPSGLEYVASSMPQNAARPEAGPTAVSLAPLTIEALEPAEYVLRVQPALASAQEAGDYAVRVRVQTAPLLSFPVAGADWRAIWSGFGAERDGGARAHRGVDIFAPRSTIAVAAADAWVTRVDTTPRGGNVVWLQPLFGNMRLYYAHLHEQFVERGQFVLAGEPIGSVGNTGNAITTPPHLHFGVYVRQPGVRGGARDPVRFLR